MNNLSVLRMSLQKETLFIYIYSLWWTLNADALPYLQPRRGGFWKQTNLHLHKLAIAQSASEQYAFISLIKDQLVKH